ncbi:MAG: hypothetical protein NZM44_02950, partial [Candidatus Calescibacterium sp.]|nr:hypothetical protein [Candidatus Calescibacterium sp.]
LGSSDNIFKNNLISFIEKNFNYLYSDVFLGNQLIFYNDSKFLAFLSGESFLISHVDFFVRSDSRKLLKFFSPKTSFGFNVQIEKGLMFYGYGIRKLSNFLVLDYKFKKILGVGELLRIILNNEITRNHYLLSNQIYKNLFLDFDVYLDGKKVIYGFGSNKSINFESYYLELGVDLNGDEFYIISNTFDLNKIPINIDFLKVRTLCEISQNSIRIYIKDSVFSLGHFLKFGIKVGGWIDLQFNHKKKPNLFVNSYNFDLEMLKNGDFEWGIMKLSFNRQKFNCNLSLNNRFFDFINLFDFIYLGRGNQDNVFELNLSSDNGIYYGDLKLNLNFKEILFKSYKLKDFYSDIWVTFGTSSLLERSSNFFDIFVNNLDKLFIEANFNVSYYVFIDEIYRRGLQNINIRLDKGVAILDGKINISLKEILKFGNWDKKIKIQNDYFADYWNQILSTGFFEIVFEKSRIGDLASFLSPFFRDFSVKEFSVHNKNIDFFSNARISLYFILFGYNYILDFEPNFGLKSGYYFLDSLKFTLFEGSELLSVIGFDYIKKKIDNIYVNKLPSFLSNLYEGGLVVNLDFKTNVFNFYFERFSFSWLSNKIFIDGGTILKDRGFVAPILKVNGSPVSIGFDGNFISLISEMKEIDIGRFYYKGRLKTNLVVSTDIENLIVYGNIDVYRGVMGYRKYELSDSVVKIPVNLFLSFNSVRFRNSFADLIFSGNLRYISDKKVLIGELKSKKGFVSLADGLYRILEGTWGFRNNILGDLYVVLQKMTSNPFDYKISIFKGNINNLSLEEFGSKTNIQNDDVISDRLSLTFFNTPLLDLVYLSSYGYTVQREIFPNVFVSYFSTYSGDKFSKLGYEWYYSIDWVISRFKLGIITANFRTYSGGRNNVGIVFVKGF